MTAPTKLQSKAGRSEKVLSKGRNAKASRALILRTAGQLFAAKGFDATSVDSIAQTAGVNKALIYYYFKNKDDLLLSLFADVLDELDMAARGYRGKDGGVTDMRAKIALQVQLLRCRREVVSLLLMEALKSDAGRDQLFDITDFSISRELDQRGLAEGSLRRCQALVHEFFTGLMPILMFVAFEEKWAARQGVGQEELFDRFMDAFEASHLNSHIG